MQPTSPVLPGSEFVEVVYAKDQPEYQPLPVVRTETCLVSRWKLSDEERKFIADGGDIYVVQMHFGQLLQPVCPMAETPDNVLKFLMES